MEMQLFQVDIPIEEGWRPMINAVMPKVVTVVKKKKKIFMCQVEY